MANPNLAAARARATGAGRLLAGLAAAIQARHWFAIELLYSDHEGGQRTVSLFSVTPRDAADDPDQWLCSVARHWNLDRPDPR